MPPLSGAFAMQIFGQFFASEFAKKHDLNLGDLLGKSAYFLTMSFSFVKSRRRRTIRMQNWPKKSGNKCD